MKYEGLLEQAQRDIAAFVVQRFDQLARDMRRPAHEQILDERVSTLQLTRRAANILRYWKGRDFLVSELVQYRRADLKKLRNFGALSLHSVESELARYGLHLAE